jgi:hypothetical protein
VLYWFGSQFSGGRPKQGEQFGRQAPDIVVILSNWVSFELPGWPRLGNGLIRSCFILTPDRQPETFSDQVGAFNDHLFLRGVGIITLFDHPIFSLAQGDAGPTPGTALLPSVARFVQDMYNRKGAHVGKPSGASRSARCKVERDQVAVLSSLREAPARVPARCELAQRHHRCEDDRCAANHPEPRVLGH